MVVGGAGMAVYISPQLALMSFALGPPVIALAVTYGKYISGQQKLIQAALGRTADVAQEAISSIRTIRLFAKELAESQRYDRAVDDRYTLRCVVLCCAVLC